MHKYAYTKQFSKEVIIYEGDYCGKDVVVYRTKDIHSNYFLKINGGIVKHQFHSLDDVLNFMWHNIGHDKRVLDYIAE